MSKRHRKEKEFDTVRYFIEVKVRIAEEAKEMTFAEFKEYLNQRKLRLGKQDNF